MVLLGLQRCTSSQILSPLEHACLPQRSGKACRHQGERGGEARYYSGLSINSNTVEQKRVLAFGADSCINTILQFCPILYSKS